MQNYHLLLPLYLLVCSYYLYMYALNGEYNNNK